MPHEDALHGGASANHWRTHHLSGSAQYVVDAEKRLVAVKFGKKMTVGDIQRYARLLQSNPSFQPDYSELVDLTQVEELDLQADQIDPFAPEAKRAFVVRNSTQRHAARMHKVLRTQRNIEIFESIEEAERWITM